MLRLLAAIGRWCAICALLLALLILVPVSWVLTLVGNQTLNLAEWAKDQLADLLRRG